MKDIYTYTRHTIYKTSYIVAAVLVCVCVYAPGEVRAAFANITPSDFPLSTLRDNLVGHWTFDGKDTNWATGQALDRSGNSNHGQIINMSTSTVPVPGKIGQAFRFDGVNDFVRVTDHDSIDFDTTENFSIAFWVEPNNLTGLKFLISKLASNGAGAGWYVRLNGNGIELRVADGTNSAVPQFSNYLTAFTRQHLIVTVNRSQTSGIKVYVNGIERACTGNCGYNLTTVGDTSNARNLGIATRDGSDPGSYLAGVLDDIRLYSGKVLSASEAMQLYNLGAPSKQNATHQLIGSPLVSGLIGHWTFDGKDVNWQTGQVVDRSGTGNAGTIIGMSTSTGMTSGIVGQAGKFDGTNDVVRVAHNTNQLLTSGFTISAWVNPLTASAQGGRIVAKDNNSSVANGFRFYWQSGSQNVAVQVAGGSGRTSATDSVMPGRWTHVLATVASDSTVTHYINGVQSGIPGTSGSMSSITTTDPLAIGADSTGGAQLFGGAIDDVHVYNRTLSTLEISQLYNLGAAAKINITPHSVLTSGLVGHWTFDGKDTNWATGKALDRSGNSSHGTLLGMSTSTTPTPGRIGQALKFDMADDYVDLGTPSSLGITGDMTVMAWINPDTVASGGKTIVANSDSTAGSVPWWFELSRTTTGRIGFLQLGGAINTGTFSTSANQNITVNVWTHVAAVRTGSSGNWTITFYHNGVQAGTGSIERDPGSNNTSAIGRAGGFSTPEFFSGKIDNVRIYNRALSASEITQAYNSGR